MASASLSSARAAHCALPDRGAHFVRGHDRRRMAFQIETLKACEGQEGRLGFAARELFEPGADIAAQNDGFEIRAPGEDLRLPAH